MTITDRAFAVADRALGRAPDDGLAHPFGLAQGYGRCWIVSEDVWDELRSEYPWAPRWPGLDSTLMGMPIMVRQDKPRGFMELW